MRETPIPNYVDSQMQVFFWEIDEFIPSVAIMTLFIIMWNQALLGLVVSYLFTKGFARFKNKNLEGVLFHMTWWHGVMGMNKRFPSGLYREFTK